MFPEKATEDKEQSFEGKSNMASLFRPGLFKAATGAATITLDRELFTKTFPLAAARIAENKYIFKYRNELSKTNERLDIPNITSIYNDPDPGLASKGRKCILLGPEVKADDPQTWSQMLREAVAMKDVGVIPYELKLDYDYWSYHDIMESLVGERPQDESHDIPVGFTIVGHVAHLNLRDQWLPYKNLIGQVLIDKNPTIKTVINKTENVGTESEFRTFPYEVLAGPDDLKVEVSEEDCLFRFDYSKVYWNSRLNTEHRRITTKFNAGEVVVDVMAGVGPFAVPAGKRGVFVWANDLNPDSHASLQDAITRNKVQPFVKAFCEDGHTFIQKSVDEVLELTRTNRNKVEIPAKRPKRVPKGSPTVPLLSPMIVTIPQTVSHFVMNLPANAIDFLPSYSGIYASHQELFEPHTTTKLPMVHVHCFAVKSERTEDNALQHVDICKRISEKLGTEINVGDPELEIFDVRNVAPKKQMYCASFRLPAEVAFRKEQGVI